MHTYKCTYTYTWSFLPLYFTWADKRVKAFFPFRGTTLIGWWLISYLPSELCALLSARTAFSPRIIKVLMPHRICVFLWGKLNDSRLVKEADVKHGLNGRVKCIQIAKMDFFSVGFNRLLVWTNTLKVFRLFHFVIHFHKSWRREQTRSPQCVEKFLHSWTEQIKL